MINKKTIGKNNLIIKTILTILFITVVYLFIGIIQLSVSLVNDDLNISGIIFIFLSILLILYIFIHISYTKQKLCLLTISFLILLLMLFRELKYGGFSPIDIVARHLWYLYYLPILFIPYFLFATSLVNYYNNNKKVILILLISVGITTLLLTLLVLFNDYHQLAFKFNDGFVNWDNDYDHGLLYYIVLVFAASLYLSSFIIFFIQCQIAKGRRYSYVSLIPLLLGFIYMIIYVLGLIPKFKGHTIICEFPETLCFMVVSYIFALINLHIIAINKNYKKIFNNMSSPAFIMDTNKNIIYKNGNKELITNNENEIVGNYLYKTTKIKGGSVTWLNDITDLNQIYNELNELNERLKEEKHINLLISNLNEEELIIREKDKLYDEIAKDVFLESSKIIDLTRMIKNDISLFNKYIPNILLLCIYIKRYSNLKLLLEEKEEIEIKELYLSINELFRYTNKIGIKTAIVGESNMSYKSEKILKAYVFLSKIILDNLDKIKGITIYFNDNYLYKLNIDGKDLNINNNIEFNIEDGVYYITITKEDII